MIEIRGIKKISRIAKSIRDNFFGLMNAPKKERPYLYGRFFFVLFSLILGYEFLFFHFCRIIAGLLTGIPIWSDFIPFYAGSKLALQGDPAEIYSITKIHALEKMVLGTDKYLFPWLYSPSFLIIILPFGLFPYGISFVLWIFPPFYGYLWIIRRIAPHPLTPWLFIVFPPAILNFTYGQNGFLSTLLLGGGLLLVDRHPFTGGLLFGLLSYKPQLTILIPVALLAGRKWRALWGAAVSSISLILISLILFGIITWKAFIDNIFTTLQSIPYQKLWAKMPTVIVTARKMGADPVVAEMIQVAVALIVICIVSWIWWKRASLSLRGSSLILGTFLVIPYAFEYDLSLTALPFAWLGWEEVSKGNRQGQALLAACWIATFLSLLVRDLQFSIIYLLIMFCFVVYRSILYFSIFNDIEHRVNIV